MRRDDRMTARRIVMILDQGQNVELRSVCCAVLACVPLTRVQESDEARVAGGLLGVGAAVEHACWRHGAESFRDYLQDEEHGSGEQVHTHLLQQVSRCAPLVSAGVCCLLLCLPFRDSISSSFFVCVCAAHGHSLGTGTYWTITQVKPSTKVRPPALFCVCGLASGLPRPLFHGFVAQDGNRGKVKGYFTFKGMYGSRRVCYDACLSVASAQTNRKCETGRSGSAKCEAH